MGKVNSKSYLKEVRDFLLRNAQTSCEPHPVSCTVCTVNSFPGRVWSCSLTDGRHGDNPHGVSWRCLARCGGGVDRKGNRGLILVGVRERKRERETVLLLLHADWKRQAVRVARGDRHVRICLFHSSNRLCGDWPHSHLHVVSRITMRGAFLHSSVCIHSVNRDDFNLTFMKMMTKFGSFLYFYILYYDQQMHNYFTNYHTLYMFRLYRVILRERGINTLPSYTSISNEAVGNTICTICTICK